MLIEDKTKIKKVILKHPEMMASNSEILIKEEYENILKLEHELAELRMKSIELDKQIEARKQIFREQSNMFELVFETKNIDYKTEECNMVVSNSSDARNNSYGK